MTRRLSAWVLFSCLFAAAAPGAAAELPRTEASRLFELACARLRATDFAGARDLYGRILIDFPGTAVYSDSLFFLAEAERAQGELSAAARHLDTFLSLYPGSPHAEEGALAACEIAARQGRAGEAADLAEALSSRFPGGVAAGRALRREADLLLGAGLFTDALAVYPRSLAALRGLPDEQEVLYSMALAHLGAGDRSRSLDLFREAAEGDASGLAGQALFNACALLAGAGRAAEERDGLEQYVRLHPRGARREEALELLAGLQDAQGDRTAAVQSWGSLVREFPRSGRLPGYLYNRGLAAVALGLWVQCLEDFQRILRDYPLAGLSAQARYAIGVVYARRGEFARALPYFQGLYAAGVPGQLADRARLAAASCSFNLGAYETALGGFERLALSAAGKTRGMLVLRAARTRYRMERLADAAREFRQAATLLGDDEAAADALYWLGWCWFRLGRLAESRDAFVEAAAASRTGRKAAESFLRAGIASSGLGDESAAVAFYDGAAAAGSDADPEGIGEKALYEKGWALVRLGREAEAEAAFDELSRRYPLSRLAAEAFFKRGTALMDADRPADALVLFRKVFAVLPDNPLAEQARYWAGQAGLDSRDYREAAEAFWGYITLFPSGALVPSAIDGLDSALISSSDATLADRILAQTAAAQGLSPELSTAVRLSCARLLLSTAPAEALPLITDAAGRNLPEPLAGEADLLLGQYSASVGEWDRARKIFSGLALSRKDRVAARARLEEARALEALGSTREAAEALLAVPSVFPGFPDLASEALFRAARISRLRGDTRGADGIERLLSARYPGSPWAQRAKTGREAR